MAIGYNRTFTFLIETGQWRSLNYAAKQLDRSKGWIVKTALEMWLRKEGYWGLVLEHEDEEEKQD